MREALNGVAHDRARVVPGVLVNLAMTTVAFLPMFIKRLAYQLRLAEPSRPPSDQAPDYQAAGTR